MGLRPDGQGEEPAALLLEGPGGQDRGASGIQIWSAEGCHGHKLQQGIGKWLAQLMLHDGDWG